MPTLPAEHAPALQIEQALNTDVEAVQERHAL